MEATVPPFPSSSISKIRKVPEGIPRQITRARAVGARFVAVHRRPQGKRHMLPALDQQKKTAKLTPLRHEVDITTIATHRVQSPNSTKVSEEPRRPLDALNVRN